MPENPSYWGTIATVIPVIALAMATTMRRYPWHRLGSVGRRWVALTGAILVGLLGWSELLSLEHLQARNSNEFDEALSRIVVGGAALQVLVAPILPLLLIAMHDMYPSIRRLKKELRDTERIFAHLQRKTDQSESEYNNFVEQLKIDGTDRVLGDPSLVFDNEGLVRPDYVDRVYEWHAAREFISATEAQRVEFQQRLDATAEKLRRTRKRVDKALRNFTKKTVKFTKELN